MLRKWIIRMNKSVRLQNLKEKWGIFLVLLFDPWVIIMLSATLFLLNYSNSIIDEKLRTILSLILSLVSGLLGGILSNRWAQMTELKVLVASGKSAIRSLKLILLHISKLEKRTKEYITRVVEGDIQQRIIVSNFEEVIQKCNILEEEIISSIENWEDVIPEVADLKSNIGVISAMKLKEIDLNVDIAKLKDEIESIRSEGSKRKQELEHLLSLKESELIVTQRKQKNAEVKISHTVLSGLTTSNITLGPNSNLLDSYVLGSKCSRCGKLNLASQILYDNVCADCRSKGMLHVRDNN
jgi:hypothetical protein